MLRNQSKVSPRYLTQWEYVIGVSAKETSGQREQGKE